MDSNININPDRTDRWLTEARRFKKCYLIYMLKMRSRPACDSMWVPGWVDEQTRERLTRQEEGSELLMGFSARLGSTGSNTTHVLTQNSPRY